jgi:hypothetical protein
MTNALKDNSHLPDFNRWYKFLVKMHECDYEYGYGYDILSNEEYLEISEFFDYFLNSPNNRYYCPTRDKTYPIGSKSTTASSYKDLLETLQKYRSHYEKMFLYMVTKPTTETYKVRFAVFPENDHN